MVINNASTTSSTKFPSDLTKNQIIPSNSAAGKGSNNYPEELRRVLHSTGVLKDSTFKNQKSNHTSHSELKFRKKSILKSTKTHFFDIFKSTKPHFLKIFKSTKTHFLLFQKWQKIHFCTKKKV